MAAAYAPHERDARTKGIPSLGAGAIYPVEEGTLLCDPFQFPPWFRHVYGLDVGWNRTAAIFGAVDPEDDILYLYSEHYVGEAQPPIHAAAIRARGEWIPGVIDPNARGRGQLDGAKLMEAYVNLGLTLLPADNAVEAGIYAVWTRMSTGRLKVFRTLQNWLGEFRIYRRDEKGKVHKENDHAMDATRYMILSGLDLAAQRPPEQWPGRPGMPPQMQQSGLQSEYDPYATARSVVGKQSGETMQAWAGIGRWDRR